MSLPARTQLISADELARDVLLDSTDVHLTDQLVKGWAAVMPAAAAAWDSLAPGTASQTDIATGTPFNHAAFVAAQVATEIPQWADIVADHRTQEITALLNQVSTSPRSATPDQTQESTLRAGILHVGHILTHAVATSTARHAEYLAVTESDHSKAVMALCQRIQGVEQVLDAHLHRRPADHVPPIGHAVLDRALNQFSRAAYGNTRGDPNPMANVIIAATARDMIGATAALAGQAARQGHITEPDLTQRLLPALKSSRDAWEDSRQAWARMLTPAQPAPQLVVAANQLKRALHQPFMADHPAINASMSTALAISVETAIINDRALTDPQLTAPATTVTRMTHDLLERQPDNPHRMDIWMSMTSLEGRAPVQLPAVLRAELAARGQGTLQAALAARSAGHVLTKSGYSPQLALHNGQAVRPPTRHCEPPTRQAAEQPLRIG